MRFSLFIIFICCCIRHPIASAQEQTIDGVRRLIRFNPYYDDNGVAGYFCFYETRKAGNGQRSYHLDLLDNDLSVVTSKPLTDDKNVTLFHGANTDNSLLLLFYKPKKKVYAYRTFDSKGEEQDSEAFTLPKSASNVNNHSLIGLNGRGFLHYIRTPEIYSIRLVADDPKSSQGWKIEKKISSQPYRIEYLASSDNLLLSSLTKFSSNSKKDADFFIVGTNLNTGEEAFETRIRDDRYAIRISNGWLDEAGVHLFGSYFEKNANVLSDKSLGLCVFTMDMEGKVISRKYLSWGGDISGFLPSNKKGKVEGIGYLFFHDFIKTQDSKIFGIAENYRKTASAGKIIGAVLNPYAASSFTKMTIEDLYVFEFTPDYTLRSIRIFEKNKTNIEWTSVSDYESAQYTANHIKATGGFDYAFTQVSKESPGFVACYFDAISTRNRIIGSIKYDGKDMTHHKSGLVANSLKSVTLVLPGKPGYALIYQYSLSKKRLKLKLERLAS